ncbi:hypothetical protein RJ640_020317 [Escallonia rubra]|uniref:Protein OSB1, mitochondrial n=1 Tax=Escallonia rubra TaxID=112253 RepID=A0AA88UP63_9ASTE|nr:hypothetical protein RJ640_020317 [Escallonia rubra]
MEATSRLRALFKHLFPYSSQLHKFRPFSSPAATVRKVSSHFPDEPEAGSPLYRHALESQRPSTIRWRKSLQNSVSFIGTVVGPLRGVGEFGLQTRLQSSAEALVLLCARFLFHWLCNFCTWQAYAFQIVNRITLHMWGEMAEISKEHLKPKDFIYVSGHLGSFEIVDEYGRHRMYYKVNVKEINYVIQEDRYVACPKFEQSESRVETPKDKWKNRLHLWQVFFSNPNEWRDNRKNKKNPKQPDFTHKDTGEALWLGRYDPPWVERQLQLHDARLAGNSTEGHAHFHSHLTPLMYDDWEAIKELE